MALALGQGVSFAAAAGRPSGSLRAATVRNLKPAGTVSVSIRSRLQSADIARLCTPISPVLQLLPRVQLLPGRVQHLRTLHKPQQHEEQDHSTVVVRSGAADAPKELDPLET
jgi:hypothetical protein